MENYPDTGKTTAPQEQVDELIALYDRGNFQHVLAQGEALSEKFPSTVVIYKILAATNFGLGNLDQAVENYTRVIQFDPQNATAHSNLGVALTKLGRAGEAVTSYEKALAIEPDNAETHNNLAGVLKEVGKTDEAIASIAKAILLKPDYAGAYFNLGIIRADLAEYEVAITNFASALDFKPDYAEAHNKMGAALFEIGKQTEAVASFNKALEIEPDLVEAHNRLGIALVDLGKFEEAIASYNVALRIEPDYAEVHTNLGAALGELGKSEEAVVSYTNALELRPDFGATHYALSRFKKYTSDDPHIDQMQLLLKDEPGYSDNRMFLNFALAKAHEDTGQIKEAFEHLAEANRVQRSNTDYEISHDKELFEKIKTCFRSYPLEPALTQSGSQKALRPIFVLGMPRSGTTLAEQIIASHSTVYGAGELTTLSQIARPIVMNSWQGGGSSTDENLHQSIRSAYLAELGKFDVPETIITDKLPLNFRWIGFIATSFPEAKIINLVRDPRAICWSIYKTAFSANVHGYTNDLADVGEFYKLYEDLMSFWRAKLPNKIYDLNYQALTENQEEETRKLLEHCELEWEDECLNFHENSRPVQTASSLQVREKMYKGSSNDWKKYERFLGPLLGVLDE